MNSYDEQLWTIIMNNMNLFIWTNISVSEGRESQHFGVTTWRYSFIPSFTESLLSVKHWVYSHRDGPQYHRKAANYPTGRLAYVLDPTGLKCILIIKFIIDNDKYLDGTWYFSLISHIISLEKSIFNILWVPSVCWATCIGDIQLPKVR